MSAKSDLFVRLKYVTGALNLPELIDQGIAVNEHNGIANLLRKGLGIVAFNVLEDFIKNRSVECLSVISQSGLPFENLTDMLKESSIFGALNALSFMSSLAKRDGGDWKTLIQEETLKIHSTKSNPYELSKFSLLYSGPNVLPNEISDLLRAFGVKEGWTSMKRVSDSIGGGIPDLAQAFRNAANRRHNAAHAAAFNYHHNWLSNFKSEIIAIAASLDILLTARLRQISRDLTKKVDDHDIGQALNYRFLEPRGAIFRELSTLTGKSRKNWGNQNAAVTHLLPTLLPRDEFLIILNTSRRIEDWYT